MLDITLEVIAGIVTAAVIMVLGLKFFPGQIILWLINNLKGLDNIKNLVNDTKENPLKATEEFLSNIREVIVDQILNKQPRLFEAIAKQRIILANQEREPVAIFLNPEIFKELLRNSLNSGHLDEVENLYEAIRELDMPIGHLGELPIYVTERLKRAPVFIAGGINWSLEG